MATFDDRDDAPFHFPDDDDKWVRGPIYEAVPKLRAMHATRAPTPRQTRFETLERQVAELRRELDELRKGIAAAAQTPQAPAAAGE